MVLRLHYRQLKFAFNILPNLRFFNYLCLFIHFILFQPAYNSQPTVRPSSADPALSAQAYGYHPGPYGNYGQNSYGQPWPSHNINYNHHPNFENQYTPQTNYNGYTGPNHWAGAQNTQHWSNWPNWSQGNLTQPSAANLGPDMSYQRTLEYVEQCQSWSDPSHHQQQNAQ